MEISIRRFKKTLERNQKEILKLKNIITERKSLEGFKGRCKQEKESENLKIGYNENY